MLFPCTHPSLMTRSPTILRQLTMANCTALFKVIKMKMQVKLQNAISKSVQVNICVQVHSVNFLMNILPYFWFSKSQIDQADKAYCSYCVIFYSTFLQKKTEQQVISDCNSVSHPFPNKKYIFTSLMKIRYTPL